jgi:hypothetical protein
LLAPNVPSRLTSLLPYLIAATLLVWAARRLTEQLRGSGESAPEEALFGSAVMIACVVASPAGWTMSFVWALPMTVSLAKLRAGDRTDAGLPVPLAVAWLACAIPPPVPGWGAIAGAALVTSAAAFALRTARRRPARAAAA